MPATLYDLEQALAAAEAEYADAMRGLGHASVPGLQRASAAGQAVEMARLALRSAQEGWGE